MLDWFKEGKTLPRRYVWEIALGAHDIFVQEESLVNLDLEDGMTIDVIGDVHGTITPFGKFLWIVWISNCILDQVNFMTCSICFP